MWGLLLVAWLREQGHDVIAIEEDHWGADDPDILRFAEEDDRVLITNDKDFGTLVYREGMAHRGIVLLRLDDERAAMKIAVVARLLRRSGDALAESYVVATDSDERVNRV